MFKTAIEELGLTKEMFSNLYNNFEGFDGNYNKNHPSYSSEESYEQFLLSGARLLVDENENVVKDIIEG